MDKMDMILERLEHVDKKIETMDKKIETMDKKIETMDKKIGTMDKKIETMDKKIETMGKKIETMDNDITSIKLTLENEVRTNIMKVAEGHLDLARNLQEAMKNNNQVEMLTVRVNVLESDVRELKQKIS